MTKSKKTKKPPRLVWIDMEMTGLNPDNEVIIEIATIITDKKLKVIEEGPVLVVHQPDKYLDGMDKWNQKHHKKSGLIKAVQDSKISLEEAEKQTLAFIQKHCALKKSPLCGNSVHHDRRFLERYMPKIHEFLHYRHIDVSTVKALIKYWYKSKKKVYEKRNAHRALGDIRESILELQHYKKKYFKSYIRKSESV